MLDKLPKEVLQRVAREMPPYWVKPLSLVSRGIRANLRFMLFEEVQLTPDDNNKSTVKYLFEHPDDHKLVSHIEISSFEEPGQYNSDRLGISAGDLYKVMRDSSVSRMRLAYLNNSERTNFIKLLREQEGFQLPLLRDLKVEGGENSEIVKYTPNLVVFEAMGDMDRMAEGLHKAVPKGFVNTLATRLSKLDKLRRVTVCLSPSDEGGFIKNLAKGIAGKQLIFLRLQHRIKESPVKVKAFNKWLPELTALTGLRALEVDVTPDGKGDGGSDARFCGGSQTSHEAHRKLALRIAEEVPSLERLAIGDEVHRWTIKRDGEETSVEWQASADSHGEGWVY